MSGERHLDARIAQPAQAHCSALSQSVEERERKDSEKKVPKKVVNTCEHADTNVL